MVCFDLKIKIYLKGKRSMRDLGRIGDIIEKIESANNNTPILDLPENIKLNALCYALQITSGQLDHLIHDNSPVMRTVKGHAFETYFDELMSNVSTDVQRVGGDDAIDRIVNNATLQLKTPYVAGTKGDFVSYKTHKTHGAKSEKESLDYYHDVRHFADYLVGLISYDPLNIVILHKSELPRHPKDINKITSPFKLKWRKHPSLNAWHLLGLVKKPSASTLSPGVSELLPLTTKFLGMKTNVILNTILSQENFRIWDMSIRGFAREVVFSASLSDRNIFSVPPTDTGRDRAEKSDHAIKSKSDMKIRFFQMKGASVNNCKFDGENSIIATETQLTRGRVNDHPTQSRLYLHTDFDYLIIGLDPSLTLAFDTELGVNQPIFDWKFFCIPTEKLDRHHKIKRRLKSVQSFKYIDLDVFKIDELWYEQWALK